jgi:hypothetical protein
MINLTESWFIRIINSPFFLAKFICLLLCSEPPLDGRRTGGNEYEVCGWRD